MPDTGLLTGIEREPLVACDLELEPLVARELARHPLFARELEPLLERERDLEPFVGCERELEKPVVYDLGEPFLSSAALAVERAEHSTRGGNDQNTSDELRLPTVGSLASGHSDPPRAQGSQVRNTQVAHDVRTSLESRLQALEFSCAMSDFSSRLSRLEASALTQSFALPSVGEDIARHQRLR